MMELKHFYPKQARRCMSKLYLDTLFTATEQPSVCKLQSFLGLGTLLTVILQPAEFSFVNGKSLKSLFWTQISLKFARDTLMQ